MITRVNSWIFRNLPYVYDLRFFPEIGYFDYGYVREIFLETYITSIFRENPIYL